MGIELIELRVGAATRPSHAASPGYANGNATNVRTVGYLSRWTMRWKFTITTATTRTTPSTTYVCCTAIVTMSFTVNSVYDKDPYAEEPDDGKLSRPVREWRRGQ